MKNKKISIGNIIGGVIIILWQLTLENNGFQNGVGGEVLGSNLVTVCFYSIGLWLIYRGFNKKEKKHIEV